MASLRRTISSGPLNDQFGEALQDACDAYAHRDAFARVKGRQPVTIQLKA